MRKLRNFIFFVAATTALGGAVAWLTVRPWWKRWGVDPDEAARPLPGDDLVPNAASSDTRGISIGASPAEIWPWLVQMGFGRAGWYSYDAIDMKGSSADRIVPELQSLEVGEIVPTHPAGGFEVRVLEPERAIVLYIDDEMAREQAAAAHEGGEAAKTPANLQAAGAFMAGAQPTGFRASWAFVLEPDGVNTTRLIERVRAEFTGEEQPWMKATMPMMGFGVFFMVRRQLLGIRERVERAGAHIGSDAWTTAER